MSLIHAEFVLHVSYPNKDGEDYESVIMSRTGYIAYVPKHVSYLSFKENVFQVYNTEQQVVDTPQDASLIVRLVNKHLPTYKVGNEFALNLRSLGWSYHVQPR